MVWWRLAGVKHSQSPVSSLLLALSFWLQGLSSSLATKDSPAATYAHKQLPVRVLPSMHTQVWCSCRFQCVMHILDPLPLHLSHVHACIDIVTMTHSFICGHATQIANDRVIVTILFFTVYILCTSRQLICQWSKVVSRQLAWSTYACSCLGRTKQVS